MLPITNNLTLTLLLALTVFAVFAACVRRGIVGARETVWLGIAVSFFGISLVFNAALRQNSGVYGGDARSLVGTTALMTLPLALTFAYGVFALTRSVTQTLIAEVNIDNLMLRLVRGSLATLTTEPHTDTIIIPALASLRMTTTEAAALHAFGGRDIEQDILRQAPIAIGHAALGTGGRLSTPHLIHAVTSAPGQPANEVTVKRALDAAFKLAKRQGFRHIAVSAFSNPPVGLRVSIAAQVVIAAVQRARRDFDTITIVVNDRRALPAFLSSFETLNAKRSKAPFPHE